MHYSTRMALAIMLLIFVRPSNAQTPLSDIRPMLKSLTKAQKLQLLEYLRHLGAETDQEIQETYALVPRSNQTKAVQFIETLKQAKKDLPTTSVQWDRDTIYFGSIVEGNPVIDSFLLTNTGNQPYLVSSTKTTCDCTVIKAPEYPVMPGETAVFRVEFDSQGKRGTAIPALLVYDNSWPNKRNILYLKGEITPRKRLRRNPWED